MDHFVDTALQQVGEVKQSQNSTNEIMESLNQMMDNIDTDLSEQQFLDIVQKLLELQKSQEAAIQAMTILNDNAADADNIIAVTEAVFKSPHA